MQEIKILDKTFSKFLSEEVIEKRIKFIADRINKDYSNAENILFLGVLDGSFMFASELYKNITLSSQISFIKIKSYENTESKNIKEIIGLPDNLENKNIIIIEDIVDSGKTINYIKNKINCKSIRIASLLNKSCCHNLSLDYFGFEISNKFAIGYGLDYNDYGRNLKGIYYEI